MGCKKGALCVRIYGCCAISAWAFVIKNGNVRMDVAFLFRDYHVEEGERAAADGERSS